MACMGIAFSPSRTGIYAWSWRAKLLSARGIERLARKMYEASCPAGAPWPHHGWNVRQAWLAKAREAAGVGPATERAPGLARDQTAGATVTRARFAASLTIARLAGHGDSARREPRFRRGL